MVCEVVRENGLGEIPSHRTSAKSWFQGNGIATITDRSDGRNPEFVRLYDLPAPERLAYLTRELEHLHLSPGSYDAAAHEAFLAASPSRRDRAERRAAVARGKMQVLQLSIQKAKTETVGKVLNRYQIRIFIGLQRNVFPTQPLQSPLLARGYRPYAEQVAYAHL